MLPASMEFMVAFLKMLVSIMFSIQSMRKKVGKMRLVCHDYMEDKAGKYSEFWNIIVHSIWISTEFDGLLL